MTTKTVTVHYCDFCKRRSFTKPSMAKHELACGANPNRVCGMCRASQNVQAEKEELQAIVVANVDEFNNLSEAGLVLLRKATADCPACILATFRQNTVSCDGFDWKKEREAWLHDNLEAMREQNSGVGL